MRAQTPLQKAIRRILIRRIGLSVVAVAAIFAAISWFHARDMVTRAVLQASISRIHVIRARIQELTTKQDGDMSAILQNAVNYPPDADTHLPEGDFVVAILHSADRDSIGRFIRAEIADQDQIASYLASTPASFPAPGQLEYRRVSIGERPFLDIHSQVLGKDPGSAIYLRALFALSDSAVASIRRQILQSILLVIGIVLGTAAFITPVISHLVGKLADSSTRLLNAQLETMEALGAAIAKRDSDTDIHNYRVTVYAVALGEKLGLDERAMQRLIKGAFLHDVGKIGIKDAILLSKAHLDPEEFAIMQTHVRHGLDIISCSSWLQDAADVVGYHHEKYDGSGYPNGVAGTSIPLNARIFALADVFDALTSKRPYKDPYSLDQTLDIMHKEQGSHFDPQLLTLFQELAPDLYSRFGGREDDGLRQTLHIITNQYFHSGLATLHY